VELAKRSIHYNSKHCRRLFLQPDDNPDYFIVRDGRELHSLQHSGRTNLSLESGKALHEPNSLLLSESSADSGVLDVSERKFARTLVPLKIPTLWFYKCNNCFITSTAEKLRLTTLRHGGLLDMLLCDKCLKLFNIWKRRWHGSSNILRMPVRTRHSLRFSRTLF